MSKDKPAYIGRCKKCGAISMATVDIPEHADDVALDVADCIRRGLSIERVTVGYVHEHSLSDCTCEQANKACSGLAEWLGEMIESGAIANR